MTPKPKSKPNPRAQALEKYPRFDQSPKALNRQHLGRSGLQYSLPGYIRRDHLPELSGRSLWLALQEMGDNDAYVGAAVNAYSMFLRRTTWHAQAASKKPADQDALKFLESCMDDMEHSWKTVMASAARSAPQFGFAAFEKVFKFRQGDQEDTRYSSNYDDGLVGWSNLAFRSPDSILHWDYDPQDVTRLVGLTQLAAPDWHMMFIPIEKLLLLRAEPGKDNPEGRSILRSAWRSWRTKKYLEDLRNIIIERGGAGIPWAEVPAAIANAPQILAADPDNLSARDAMGAYQSLVDTLENICQDTQKWVITPQVWDAQGRPQFKISFLQPSMGADIIHHITRSIDAEAKAILMSIGAEFIALGMGGSGSLALSRDKTDNFTLAIEAIADSFESSINSQLVRQLFRLNPQFEDLEALPRIVHDPIVPLSTQDIVAVLGFFEKAGLNIASQPGLRDTILQNMGLPPWIEHTPGESNTNESIH
jgi:hypothetical protein